ncbi:MULTISPECIES: hypothetical protein [unclassified Pseudomonas]|uniref:hypothetical protein n=1 Tax=unclassified Pseudomonas TaxID=196821 RepID=UPI000C886BA0|nr:MULTISPECIES: hypothetical protein [unclassified Pseudomonas]PMZ91381.1 hypothetical protein C1X61_05315 [Pseudomonas sp. FW215-T2]PNA14597.1 hypothetical protein C1X62_06695 [Pseudomonas sp. FW215-R3]PNB38574.1 hypothetical protein C1X63_07140 [Pseudomonas sp. FW305-131]
MAGFFSSEKRPFHFSTKALIVMRESDPMRVTRGSGGRDGKKPIILSARERIARLILRLPLIAKTQNKL